MGRWLLGAVLSPDLKQGQYQLFWRDGSMTPDERECLNRIKRDGASSCAQLSNREHGIPSGPAAEFVESSPYRINND